MQEREKALWSGYESEKFLLREWISKSRTDYRGLKEVVRKCWVAKLWTPCRDEFGLVTYDALFRREVSKVNSRFRLGRYASSIVHDENDLFIAYLLNVSYSIETRKTIIIIIIIIIIFTIIQKKHFTQTSTFTCYSLHFAQYSRNSIVACDKDIEEKFHKIHEIIEFSSSFKVTRRKEARPMTKTSTSYEPRRRRRHGAVW